MRRIACLLILIAVDSFAWDLFLSASEGYTHYQADDLNRVLVLLERTTNEKGFNPYKVNRFDGHPQSAMVMGVSHGHWRLGVEAEFWVEEFHQAEVPFDLKEAGREYRITCDTLRNPNYQTDGRIYGCVDAREKFNILPITFQVSYGMDMGRHFRAEAGYALGVLAGSATIQLTADYFGEGVINNDKVRFDVWPGINPVHKAFVDLEYLPWRFLGIAGRFGLRISELNELTLKNQEGDSRIFSTVFPEAREGAHLYVQSFTENPEDDKIFVGTEADARAIAAHDNTRFHLVRGDFTGWMAGLKLNLYWRGL